MSMEIQRIEKEVAAFNTTPPVLKITTSDESLIVGKFLQDVIGFRKRIQDFFRPDIDAAHQLHKSLLDKMKQVDAKPAQAEATCRGMIAAWQDAENERIRKEQARLDEEARKKAAIEAKKDGDKKLAKDIESGKVAVVSTVVAAPIAKVDGVSTREAWKAQVIDKMAFIKAVAAGKLDLSLVEVNVPALTKMMQATKGQMQIPGVRSVKETIVIHRAA